MMILIHNSESKKEIEKKKKRKIQGVKEPEGEAGHQGVSGTWFPKISNKHKRL